MINNTQKTSVKWQEETIGNLCEIINGKTPLRSNNEFWENGDVPWFTIDDQRKQGRIISKTNQFITKLALEKSGIKLVPKDSVLLCCTASVGEYAITKIPITTNQQYNALVIKNKEQIIPEYLFQHTGMITEKLKSIMGKTTFGFVSVGTLGSIKIKYPNIGIQQKIATILSSIDEAIQKTYQIIEKTEKLKNGLMTELLTKGIGHTKFKKTKIGEIPESWKVSTLSDVCDVRDGTHESPKYIDKGYPLITSKNLTEYGLDFSDIKYISEADYKNISKRSGVNIGDILFGMIGTIGKPIIIDTNIEFSIKNVALIKFFPKSEVDNRFILHYLKSNLIAKQFAKMQDGSTQKFVSLGTIRNLSILVPNIEEQKIISNIIDQIEVKINSEVLQKMNLLKLKKSLMTDIFSQKLNI